MSEYKISKENEAWDTLGDGCNLFIPVDLIGENKCTKELEVVTRESGRITFVPTIYKLRKPPEQQKVTVPKFVGEWIVETKKIHNNLSLVWFANPVSDELNAWLKNNTETFMRAWLDGYEIEQEKLYTVEIPNPNSAGGKTVLFKQKNTNSVIMAMLDENINKPKYLWLTEQEIRKDFDWAWQFAEEVEL